MPEKPRGDRIRRRNENLRGGGEVGGGLERERGEFSRLGKLPEVNILFEFVVVVVEFLELVLELSLVVAARML